jgi:hypothetical protein
MKSNIAIRSNIFVRSGGTELRGDIEFLRQVRGRGAVRALLNRLSIDTSPASLRAVLSPRQIGELIWETPCATCRAIPEGPIRLEGREIIAFRCPSATCETKTFRARTVLLPLALLQALSQKYREPISELVNDALSKKQHRRKKVRDSEPKVRIPVKLTPAQYYLFDDSDLEHALYCLLENT